MTTTILTRPATDALGRIQDRTPVIVPAELQDDWLDPGLTDKSEIGCCWIRSRIPHWFRARWGGSWATSATTGRD